MGRGGSGESLKVRLFLTWRWRQLVWRTGTFVKMNLIPPFSSQVLDHMGPWAVLWNPHASPTPPPQSQSISLLCDFPETRFSSSDRQLIPPLASGLYLNAPSWGRDPQHTRKASAPSFSSTCPALSCPVLPSRCLLFLASLTASRDGAVGEGRSGERVGWYLLSTGFAGK